MGEYFDWVNVDKKEYLCPADFDLGNKRTESCWRGASLLNALYELLSSDWKGDHIVFLGDEAHIPEDSQNATLKKLYLHTVQNGDPSIGQDAVYELYRNVSCLFHEAEPIVREAIGYYIEDIENGICDNVNEYKIDLACPYSGLFLREGRAFPYVVNHTKKVYYGFDQTIMLDEDGTPVPWKDPLPSLMVFSGNVPPGKWLGDVIGVAETVPDGYELLETIRIED